MKRWYVVQVLTGYEEAVKKTLEKRIAVEGLQKYFGDILVPMGKKAQFWSDEEEEKEKIFPGYILVEMEMVSDAYQLVKSLRHAYKFLGGDNPVPLSQKDIDRIFSQVRGEIEVAADKVPFTVGSEVHISTGPFAGFVGIIDKIDEEHKKLSVMVSIFGRLTPVELTFDQVKK